MAKYAVINVLRFENGELQYSDDDHLWQPVGPESVTASPRASELVVWVAGKNVDKITDIRLDSGESIFVNPPKKKFGGKVWIGKISPNARPGAEAKYNIFFNAGGVAGAVDPKVKVDDSGGGG